MNLHLKREAIREKTIRIAYQIEKKIGNDFVPMKVDVAGRPIKREPENYLFKLSEFRLIGDWCSAAYKGWF